ARRRLETRFPSPKNSIATTLLTAFRAFFALLYCKVDTFENSDFAVALLAPSNLTFLICNAFVYPS
ncbi:MAG: hypothetical protein RMM53_13855, partial [Bacteroidia bacterium]|nr:hypothetical protein [Bacteroidia bacterium]